MYKLITDWEFSCWKFVHHNSDLICLKQSEQGIPPSQFSQTLHCASLLDGNRITGGLGWAETSRDCLVQPLLRLSRTASSQAQVSPTMETSQLIWATLSSV